ncbi:uncharacterized protein LOC123683141 [Harmonia axyridis]|uniref:uncharacterized protein LOC123683141 n=1 Tax=Harmonia axyridis TaxID=115357 RepID=UPI001E275DEB|nr:uncharacterized protein LOC123683141 [Harmonia axyridis]
MLNCNSGGVFVSYPWAPAGPDIYRYDEDLKSSYFRRKVHVDPSRYTWMPSDDESVRMEKPKSILEPTHSSGSNQTPAPIKKHVSFARSHTLTSFDDAFVSLNSSSSHLGKMTRSQERLLDVRKTETQPITRQPEPSESVLLIDKLKRTPMKCQATQTDVGLGRKPVPAANISLSPRTIQRVKMVSQGAQTNGFSANGRRLTKSFSEAGSKFQVAATETGEYFNCETVPDHEPLQRTQSDEPPRSPFILNPSPTPLQDIPPPLPSFSETSSISKSDYESEESDAKKEIFIDFKPRLSPCEAKPSKRPLTKAMSDGEILVDQLNPIELVSPVKPSTSLSEEYLKVEDEPQRNFVPYFQKSPIRHEGIFKKLDDPIFSSLSFDDPNGPVQPQDSMDEEFHENLIYNKMYINHQDSLSITQDEVQKKKIETPTPEDECVVPSISMQKSPFNSTDSLVNDNRDHSDGIWNESQATVLQVDSGTDNGTAISSSEIASLTSPGSVNLLTPSSRRRHLLMLQHQQRSSFDTENLDDEFIEQIQSENTPKIVINKPKRQYQSEQLLRPLNTPNFKDSTCSLSRKKRSPESPSKSPQPAIVPDLLLARTDSCKTNTDVSESTTTDDYITANSGTDSSRKSGSTSRGNDIYSSVHQIHPAFEESSFESTKGDFLDDMVVPSVLPPIVDEPISHHRSSSNTPVPHESRTGRSTPSDSSSSCGSYSINGSCPDLLERSTVPSKLSENERYKKYSSPGCYESPNEDEHSRHSLHNETATEPHHKKRPYLLEIAKHQEPQRLSPSEKYKNSKKDVKVSPSRDHHKTSDKPKRTKMRNRSPMQNHKKIQQKKSYYLRTDAIDDDRIKSCREGGKATSDESSCDFAIGKYVISQTSPRKSKKGKESNRRKSLPRSPIIQPVRRGSEEKSVSLPGSLQRRKSSKSKCLQPGDANTTNPHSPTGSPNSKSSKSRSPQSRSPENTKLKALSAESLRSVSPGSDSVFYSDPSSHATDHQVHCLHCGKEVDIITTTDIEKSSNSSQHDIVQPPAGFEDSPKLKHPSGKIYKKLNRRIRSEERNLLDQRRHRYKPDVRAKSEERDVNIMYNKKLRPMDRSTTNSQEILKTTDSSPSVLPGAPEEEDDYGIYDVPYTEGYWIYLDEKDMQSKAASPIDKIRSCSVSSTESEQDFKKRYQSVIHRMVHRKSCLEMYKRQTSRSFACFIHDYKLGSNFFNLSSSSPWFAKDMVEIFTSNVVGTNSVSSDVKNTIMFFSENGFATDSEDEHNHLRHKLEEILKLMLVIWCKENQALNVITAERNESDKTVVVQRQSGEFGFRIHGSKPVVVSAIEPGTPAETSGLEVGDIVLAVNGVSVIDKSHSEVVKIAHAGSDTLTLEVARTCYAVNTAQDVHSTPALYSGYLWKLSGYASGIPSNKWIRRWFVLRQNNCLYYYKTDSDKQPVGAMMLYDHEVRKLEDNEGGLSKPNRFSIQRPDSVPLQLSADNREAQTRWMEVIAKAIADSQIVDEFLEETKRNLVLAPCSITNPDCFGYLVKLGNQWKSWSRRYCVLKDACLYFYSDASSKNAFGVAYLHGYRVQQSLPGSKKHAFEIIPPDPERKHYYFHSESDADRRRWIAALEYSIDRWLKIN